MPKRTPGSDNRVLLVCRLLNALADLPLGISRELDAEQVASRPDMTP